MERDYQIPPRRRMRIDVIVPGPWWNALTYETEGKIAAGVRVRVPVGRSDRIGFVLGASGQSRDCGFDVRPVREVMDEEPVLDQDLWDLALWMGRAWLCGAGLALTAVCPKEILDGEPLPPPAVAREPAMAFRETHCFNPSDGDRLDLYLQKAADGGRVLILFPEKEDAEKFYSHMPEPLKSDALLWPSSGGKKLWDAWRSVRSGDVRIVAAPPGGVFAPLMPDRIIVDGEANPAYVFQRPPRVNARSAAGRRAAVLGAELTLGGRIPSSKTFIRSLPSCDFVPDRKKIIFVDMRDSLRGEERGVDGTLPLTFSLLRRTRGTLEDGRHVLWLLDRRGEAAEVFCAECGHALRCLRCGGVMRAEDGGKRLRCVMCGRRDALPSRCPDCGGELWSGKRPGLEALAAMAGRLLRGCPVLLHDGKAVKVETPSIILGTRGAMTLCGKLDIGLAAWLDLDAELRRAEYGSRFQAFSMVWESYWRGRGHDETSGRTVLIQSRRGGGEWRDTIASGWGRFWRTELKLRRELGLPPFGIMARIDLPRPSPRNSRRGDSREAFLSRLEDAGLFVMDPGEGPLWIVARSAASVAEALSSRFGISNSRDGFPTVTVWTD